MKKIKEFLIDYSFYLFMVFFTIFIIVMINYVNNESFDYMLLVIGTLMLVFCIIISLFSVSHNKKRINELYEKFGEYTVRVLLKYTSLNLEKEYGKKVANNYDVDRVYEYICYNCNDLLESESNICYLESDYKKDIKVIKDIKGTNDFIKKCDEVEKIISKYYDKNGNRKYLNIY